ncbi:MAG: hypothetical protein HZC28_09865 [Spirochaetes bacterium]|nr:hypothetical protein [Spirochaetota bacterium]
MTAASLIETIQPAHETIWRRFIAADGALLDYTGADGGTLLPDVEDHRDNRPNALGWWTSAENGPFFGGLYLSALCDRYLIAHEPLIASRASSIARWLLSLAVASQPGFIARGLGPDGKSHYRASSSDQTYPWFYCMWRYAASGIPTGNDRAVIVAAMDRTARALVASSWRIYCAPPSFGYFGNLAGGFADGAGDLRGEEPAFDAAVRILFIHRAMADLTGDAFWTDRYRSLAAETVNARGETRITFCSRGAQYAAPGASPHYPDNTNLWTSASSQAGLRALYDMETDSRIREQFQRGLSLNAERALVHLPEHRHFDNDSKLQASPDWRKLNELWKPQETIEDAVRVATAQYGMWHNGISPRKQHESIFMRDPLFAGWIVALSGDAHHITAGRQLMERMLQHYRWDRMFSVFFFMAECMTYRLGISG